MDFDIYAKTISVNDTQKPKCNLELTDGTRQNPKIPVNTNINR